MSFWIFYILCLLPVAFGGILWIFNKKVNWVEWVVGCVISFIIAGIMHLTALHGQTADVETWSGQIIQAKHYAAWKEYYEEAIYRTEYYHETEYYTDSDGKSQSRTVTKSEEVFDHWEPRNRWHRDSYDSHSNINTSYLIDANYFKYFTIKFNDCSPVRGDRATLEHNSRMIEGDPNDYVAQNKTGWVEPITKKVSFENRVKATPSTFSFIKVPKDVKVFEYPRNDDAFHSGRLLGSAALLDLLKFDQMNARLGPNKKVNVIMVGFGDKDKFYTQWQEAAWIRGKKNDIVITFGGSNKSPTWVKTFSWGEGIALKNIETYLLESGVTNDSLVFIESEIFTNFKRGDWHRFDYLSIEIQMKYVWIFLAIMVITQVGWWFFAHFNECDKQRCYN